MMKPRILEVVVVGMFIFGLAISLSHRNTLQEAPTADNIIEVPSQQDRLVSSVN